MGCALTRCGVVVMRWCAELQLLAERPHALSDDEAVRRASTQRYAVPFPLCSLCSLQHFRLSLPIFLTLSVLFYLFFCVSFFLCHHT